MHLDGSGGVVHNRPPMERRTVEVRIAGQSYKLVSSAAESELKRLAETVDAKVKQLAPPGKAPSAQAVLLAAMALAHELEAERAKRQALERRARDLLRRVLVRLDDALEPDEDEDVDGEAEHAPSGEGRPLA